MLCESLVNAEGEESSVFSVSLLLLMFDIIHGNTCELSCESCVALCCVAPKDNTFRGLEVVV